MNDHNLSLFIKDFAQSLGFLRCGIAPAHEVDTSRFEQWLDDGCHAEMSYLSNHLSIRRNPSLMLPQAKSVIMCAANYYPDSVQPEDEPQIAYFAYGRDYHKWMKKRLVELERYISSLIHNAKTRSFVDTAPIFERYWAAKSGIGFVGKSNNLIIPDAGTYFVLGGLLVDVELEYDVPLTLSCGSCQRCIDSCPTAALKAPYLLDARLCLSYRTIEHKGDYSSLPSIGSHQRFFGCDACQQVCPFNRFAQPTTIAECAPLPFMGDVSALVHESFSEEEFSQTFQSSPLRRLRKEGFERNAKQFSKPIISN